MNGIIQFEDIKGGSEELEAVTEEDELEITDSEEGEVLRTITVQGEGESHGGESDGIKDRGIISRETTRSRKTKTPVSSRRKGGGGCKRGREAREERAKEQLMDLIVQYKVQSEGINQISVEEEVKVVGGGAERERETRPAQVSTGTYTGKQTPTPTARKSPSPARGKQSRRGSPAPRGSPGPRRSPRHSPSPPPKQQSPEERERRLKVLHDYEDKLRQQLKLQSISDLLLMGMGGDLGGEREQTEENTDRDRDRDMNINMSMAPSRDIGSMKSRQRETYVGPSEGEIMSTKGTLTSPKSGISPRMPPNNLLSLMTHSFRITSGIITPTLTGTSGLVLNKDLIALQPPNTKPLPYNKLLTRKISNPNPNPNLNVNNVSKEDDPSLSLQYDNHLSPIYDLSHEVPHPYVPNTPTPNQYTGEKYIPDAIPDLGSNQMDANINSQIETYIREVL